MAIGTPAPPTSVAPTAVHFVAAVHDTATSWFPDVPAGVGIGWSDQV